MRLQPASARYRTDGVRERPHGRVCARAVRHMSSLLGACSGSASRPLR